MKRMNREQFFAKVAALDAAALRKALWNVYWRGTDNIRERIEAEIDPESRPERQNNAARAVDAEALLEEIEDFVALAESGAYQGGDRRVSPRERSRWRFTFQRLAAGVEAALGVEDVGDAAFAAAEELIDFASDLSDFEYFHTEDAVEAARFVVSDAAAMLWTRLLARDGFPPFAAQAARQLLRWESRYGWTHGFGRVAEKEQPLATVIAGMLRNPDAWTTFADRYLDALDEAARDDDALPKHSWRSPEWARSKRADALSPWHSLLFERLIDSEAEDRLDRLIAHRALASPEATYLEARLADRRGDRARARVLMGQCLEKLPGHPRFLEFAQEIGAELPARAREALSRQIKPR